MDRVEQLQVELAQERFARALVARGIDPQKADAIAKAAHYHRAGDAVVLIDLEDGSRAISTDAASIDKLAAHAVETGVVETGARSGDPAAHAARAAGKAAAKQQREDAANNLLAFK
jgi:hypothetical protein